MFVFFKEELRAALAEASSYTRRCRRSGSSDSSSSQHAKCSGSSDICIFGSRAHPALFKFKTDLGQSMQTLSDRSMVSLQSRSRSHCREAGGSSVVGAFFCGGKKNQPMLSLNTSASVPLSCIALLFQYASFNGAVTAQ